jgi:hypothetical protein
VLKFHLAAFRLARSLWRGGRLAWQNPNRLLIAADVRAREMGAELVSSTTERISACRLTLYPSGI